MNSRGKFFRYLDELSRCIKMCIITGYVTHPTHTTPYTHLRICQEQWRSHPASRGPDMSRRCYSSSHGRVCSYRGPIPNWARCCQPDSDNRHCEAARPPSRLLLQRGCLVASCSIEVPIRACPSCIPPSLVCNLYSVRLGVGGTSACRLPKSSEQNKNHISTLFVSIPFYDVYNENLIKRRL